MGRSRRLWVIDPSVNQPESEGVAEVLGDWQGSSRLFRPSLNPGEGPGPETGFETDGIVLMGSASSVHDSPDWLEPLTGWLRPILHGEVRVPLLGICFGHQLIAHLAGGKVGWHRKDHARRPGIGVSTLEGGRLLPGRHELRVVVSHREEVQRAPDGYRVCASRPEVPIDGLEHRQREIFSFQFHPEAREEFADHAQVPRVEIDERVRRDGRRVLGAFRERIERG